MPSWTRGNYMKDITKEETYCDKLKGEMTCSHVTEFIYGNNKEIIAAHKEF